MEQQLHIAQLESDNAQLLADHHGIFEDLGFCIRCCDRLTEQLEKGLVDDEDLHRAWWTAAVIAYARCFATGVRYGLTVEIFSHFEGEPAAAHQLYVDMRNKH